MPRYSDNDCVIAQKAILKSNGDKRGFGSSPSDTSAPSSVPIIAPYAKSPDKTLKNMSPQVINNKGLQGTECPSLTPTISLRKVAVNANVPVAKVMNSFTRSKAPSKAFFCVSPIAVLSTAGAALVPAVAELGLSVIAFYLI